MNFLWSTNQQPRKDSQFWRLVPLFRIKNVEQSEIDWVILPDHPKRCQFIRYEQFIEMKLRRKKAFIVVVLELVGNPPQNNKSKSPRNLDQASQQKKVIQITQQINKLYRSKTLQLTKKVEKLGRICGPSFRCLQAARFNH